MGNQQNQNFKPNPFGNKGNQQQQQQQPKAATIVQPENAPGIEVAEEHADQASGGIQNVAMSEAQTEAINWLATTIKSARRWRSKQNGSHYATITFKDINPNNGVHNHPSDVARDLLAAGTNDRTFVTYSMNIGGEKCVARMISLTTTDNPPKAVFALEIEEVPTGVVGGMTRFVGRTQSADAVTEVVQPARVGFGSLT